MENEKYRDPESAKNYHDLKLKLEQAFNKVHKTSDLRQAKGYLIEVQECFKGIKLLREDREELYGKLQDAFADVNRKINEERQNFENEAALNYFNLKNKVEEALFLASNPKDLRETWDFLVEVQSLFKGAKLLREHREALYAKLQEAFEKVKKLQNVEKDSFMKEADKNYSELKQKIENAVSFAMKSTDSRAAKDLLIETQAMLREAVLAREQKDEFYEKMNEAFEFVNNRVEHEKEQKQQYSENRYGQLKQQLKEASVQAEQSEDFRSVREQLKNLQNQVREADLLREHRIVLQEMMQNAFDSLNARQDAERNSYLTEASENYKRLNSQINKGLTQAKESDKFRETREFLKSIQSEFRGIKLLKEEREELYARLQSAFQLLNSRIDEYFRTKQKNWMVRMQFKLSEMFTEIEMLKENLLNDEDVLSELETQLDIVKSSGKDNSAMKALEVRILTVRKAIEHKHSEIQRLEAEMLELKSRVEPEDDQEEE
jgi:hypothetical protein